MGKPETVKVSDLLGDPIKPAKPPDELSDPDQWPLLKDRFVTLRVSRYAHAWLKKLEAQSGARSHSEALTLLLETVRRDGLVLPASLKLIFKDDRPVGLCGPSGSGKSLFLKTKLLPHLQGPVFLVDPADEYTGLRKVGVGGFFEIRWNRADAGTRLKFVPSSNLDVSRGELRTVFSHLNMLKVDGHGPERLPSGPLAAWAIICDEGHRLARETAFLNFLAEARKFVRKLIVVASDPSLYGAVCRLVKPPPLEELLPEVKDLR